MASCFFLIRSSVDRDKITKTVTFSTLGDFGFSMSPRDMYYRFYKISPGEGDNSSPSSSIVLICFLTLGQVSLLLFFYVCRCPFFSCSRCTVQQVEGRQWPPGHVVPTQQLLLLVTLTQGGFLWKSNPWCNRTSSDVKVPSVF